MRLTSWLIGGNCYLVGALHRLHTKGNENRNQRVVPKVGIEPTTYGLWGHRSNQLSYSGISIRIVDEPPFFSIYKSPSMNSVSRAIWRLRPDLNRRPLEWQSSILTNWTTEPNENQESVHHYTIRVELSLFWSSLIQKRITGCLPSWTFPLSCLVTSTGFEPVIFSLRG